MVEPTGTLLQELDASGCRPVVVASHPRSGTHLCLDSLRLNCPELRARKRWLESADRLYLGLDDAARSGQIRHALIARILRRRPQPLVKTHALPGLGETAHHREAHRLDPQLTGWLNRRAAFIYIYRDGRDALCSLWQFMRGFAAEARVPFSHFIRQEVNGMNRVEAWVRHVSSWIQCPGVEYLTMEELRLNPDQVLRRLARHLGTDVCQRPLTLPRPCGAAVFERMVRRIVPEPASTAIAPVTRSRRISDWKQIFLPDDREFFCRYGGDLLRALGFESSDEWAASSAEPGTRQQRPLLKIL